MPSAVVLSILIHAGLFLAAGVFVVFTVLPQPPVEFEPPPKVKTPKMPIKKLQVKVKKPTKPKASAKLTAVVKKPDLHEIAFPDLPSSGVGTGIGGDSDVVSFDILPDLEDVTIFGGGQTIGNDFTGTFYDMKRKRNGTSASGIDNDEFMVVLDKFLLNDWKTSYFARFYRAPKKLYATCFMIPLMHSALAPSAFSEPDVEGLRWCAHYKGKLVYPEPITFRFVGNADDVLAVRVDGELVLLADREHDLAGWNYAGPGSFYYRMGNRTAEVGKLITLEANTPVDMEVLIAEKPGGFFCAMLCITLFHEK